MSEEKKQKMSAKRFVKAKLSGRITAEGFLEAHRGFLNSHSFLQPILKSYDEKELMPTATLEKCKAALFDHVVASEIKKAEEQIAKAQSRATIIIRKPKGEPAPAKGYTITVMVKVYGTKGGEEIGTYTNSKGEEVPTLFETLDYGSAERKADRVLFSLSHSLYAIIENNAGPPVCTKVLRADAIARILRNKKGAVSKVRGKTTNSLSFGVRARNDHSSFSRG